MDKWKIFQVDNYVPAYDPQEGIEVFWKQVFELQASNGDYRYKVLPVIVKLALVVAQANAESECSLSVNARIVTEERPSLGEKIMFGLHVVKGERYMCVWFFDPVSYQPEQIPIEPNMKKAVKSADAPYKEHLEKEKEMERKEKEEERKQKEMTEKEKKVKAKLLKRRSCCMYIIVII